MTLEEINNKIVTRIKELNKIGEYDLGNAYDSLKSLKNYYSTDKRINTQLSFNSWYRLEKNKQLQGIGVASDITYWVSDVDNLYNKDISDSDYELFDKYFKLYIEF